MFGIHEWFGMREVLRWVCRRNPMSWLGAHVLPPLTDDLNLFICLLFVHSSIHSFNRDGGSCTLAGLGFMHARQSLYQLSDTPGPVTTIFKMKFFFPLVQHRGKQGQSSAFPFGPTRANQMLKQRRKMAMNMAHPPPEAFLWRTSPRTPCLGLLSSTRCHARPP